MTAGKSFAIGPSLPAGPTRSERSAQLSSRMGSGWRKLLAAILALHGFAHVVGTTDAIRAIQDGGSLEYAFGRWELTSTPALIIAGMVWTLVAAAFGAVAAAAWMHTPRWTSGLHLVAATSFLLCLVALPQTVIGLVVNAALLATASQGLRMQHGASR